MSTEVTETEAIEAKRVAEVTESNKLIAEFLGYKIAVLSSSITGAHKEASAYLKNEAGEITKVLGKVSKLPFSTSYDAIMPAWIKFREQIPKEGHQKMFHTNYVARLAQDLAYATVEEFCHNLQIAIKWANSLTQKS